MRSLEQTFAPANARAKADMGGDDAYMLVAWRVFDEGEAEVAAFGVAEPEQAAVALMRAAFQAQLDHDQRAEPNSLPHDVLRQAINALADAVSVIGQTFELAEIFGETSAPPEGVAASLLTHAAGAIWGDRLGKDERKRDVIASAFVAVMTSAALAANPAAKPRPH